MLHENKDNKKSHKASMDNHDADNGTAHTVPSSKVVSSTGASYKPHLLVYAHYYYPDTASTGQIIQDLAEGMLDTFCVTVICVVPSYLGIIEDKWKTQKYYFENFNGVDVVRVAVPEFTKSSKISRVKNILAYFFRAMKATGKVGKVDYVMSVSQPPILGGLLGVWGKWTLKSDYGKHPRYIYQVQDFNPEQILAVNYSKNKFITGLMMFLDKFSCKHADLVITVGRDLMDTLNNRFSGKEGKPKSNAPKSVLINNWIDEKEIYPLPSDHPRVKAFKKQYGLMSKDGANDKFVIMYSGNIGLYYDLEKLVKVMKQFRKGYTLKGVYESGPVTADGKEVVFAFVGAGSVLDKLVLYTQRHHFENVVFIPYQDKDDLIYSLNAGDVHWCVNAKGIKGVSCPSKAYGIMAVGKPIIGVLEEGTEVRGLIEECNCGKCCEPGDYVEVADIIRWYIENAGTGKMEEMGRNGREYLMKRLTKEISLEKYKRAILEE